MDETDELVGKMIEEKCSYCRHFGFASDLRGSWRVVGERIFIAGCDYQWNHRIFWPISLFSIESLRKRKCLRFVWNDQLNRADFVDYE